MKRIISTFIVCLFLFQITSCKKQGQPDKMDWWKEARFGMFIHWGLYAIPAGVYNNKDIPGLSEWIMSSAKIPVAEYKVYAKQFNPVDFNADSWVKLAKEAGMRYIILTSKHHDGFALFDSKASEFDIMDATPFKRDILAELAAACKKYDMPLGFYYSQAQDWVEPGAAVMNGHWDDLQLGDMNKYLDEKAVPQVTEILNNYGEIKILWWDTPVNMTHEQISKFMPEMKKHPQLIYNDRLGGDFKGDLETPEQYIPATGIPGKNWEVCMTMNESWGFKKNDNDWKSTKSLVHNLIDIASKGGNFLLNVGPDQMGIIPQASVERLKEIGSWMDIYGEAIYGTTASPFEKIEWGRCTKKVSKQKTTLYFHIFDFPENKKLTLTGLEANILKAYPLASKKQKLKIEKQGNCPVIDLSNVEPNQWATVIAVEVPNEISVYHAPAIETNFSVFLDTIIFSTSCNIENAIIRYTTDGSIPDANSPTSVEKNILNPTSDFVLKAACFNGSNIASYVSEMEFKKTAVVAASKVNITKPGIRYNYYEKNWEALPNYSTEIPVESGICDSPNTNIRKRDFSFGFLFNGYIDIPKTGIYQFRLTSDDGSLLSLSGNTILNDGIHGMETKILDIALEKGLHPIEIQYFQQGGGHGFDFSWKSGDEEALPVDKIYWKH